MYVLLSNFSPRKVSFSFSQKLNPPTHPLLQCRNANRNPKSPAMHYCIPYEGNVKTKDRRSELHVDEMTMFQCLLRVWWEFRMTLSWPTMLFWLVNMKIFLMLMAGLCLDLGEFPWLMIGFHELIHLLVLTSEVFFLTLNVFFRERERKCVWWEIS